jgi:hypothetical protein
LPFFSNRNNCLTFFAKGVKLNKDRGIPFCSEVMKKSGNFGEGWLLTEEWASPEGRKTLLVNCIK